MGIKREGNKKNYHWEIWQREIEYERVQQASVSYMTYHTSTTNVYDFLKTFPDKRYAKDFLITDVVDYLISLQRERKYSHNSCARVGHDIAAFWNWMRRYKDETLPNMRVESFIARRATVTALTESQFLKLCDGCWCDEDRTIFREALIGIAAGKTASSLGLTYQALRYRWNKIRVRAGLPFLQLKKLHRSYRGLILRLGADTLTRLVGERTSVEPPVPTIPDTKGTLLSVVEGTF